jgi:hypothetical protein
VSPSMYPGKTKQKIRSVQSQQKSKTFFPVWLKEGNCVFFHYLFISWTHPQEALLLLFHMLTLGQTSKPQLAFPLTILDHKKGNKDR